jgi:hypothetical protein
MPSTLDDAIDCTTDFDRLRRWTTADLDSRIMFVSREPGFYVEPARSVYLPHLEALRTVRAERSDGAA